MRAPTAKTWVALGSLALVLFLVTLDLEKTSPGPLAPVHAHTTGCAQCHGEDGGAMDAACLECHQAIGEDIAAEAGLHGTLEGVSARACGLCHLEHHGEEVAPITARSFALAGVENAALFDHARVGAALAGAHLQLDCDQCHRHVDDVLLAAGTSRYHGLDGSCAQCHDDPHEGRMARACADCHGQEGEFTALTAFVHDAGFSLEGGHGGLDCAECHQGAYAFDQVAGHQPPAARACDDCHDDPHGDEFLGASEGCASCHDAQDWTTATLVADQHDATGFVLEAAHIDVACVDCHEPSGLFAARFPGRRADDCAACHGDPHGGQFEGGAFQSCLDCHSTDAFSPCTFGLEQHALTAFPLEAAHADAACSECHGEDMATLRGTPTDCAACHEDPHQGQFEGGLFQDCADCHTAEAFSPCAFGLEQHALTAFPLEAAHADAACSECHGEDMQTLRGTSSACAECHADPHQGAFAQLGCGECHQVEAFAPIAPSARFDHGLSGFGLSGAHAQTSCAACHPALAAPTALGRNFARASEHFGGAACADCHVDPHGQRFGADCAACHGTVSFRLLTGDFDHGAATGYALAGAHAQAACGACHAPRAEPDDLGRTYQPARGTTCSDCHRDPHVGQFSERASCESCHDDPAAWTASVFDHDSARFALDELHAPLDCAKCHQAWPLPSGGEAVRYRPLGTSCRDCHGFDKGDRR